MKNSIQELESQFTAKFIHIITKGKKVNTYKFALAKSILEFVENNRSTIEENIKNDTETPISYSIFANDFFRYYWRMAKYKLPQDIKNSDNKKNRPYPIQYAQKLFENLEQPQPERFIDVGEETKKKVSNAIMKKVFGKEKSSTSHVVPRFQKMVRGNSSKKEEIFYKNDEKNKQILVFPNAMKFFIENRFLLEKFVVLEWAKFIDHLKTAPSPAIISKIEEPDYDRDKSLKPFLKILRPFMKRCFYCNRKLNELKEEKLIHVDHFIPRSYVGVDRLWNLVLSCSRCNLKKSDSLAKDYVEKFIDSITLLRTDIKQLDISLKELDRGFGWKKEVDRIYTNCLDYGFMEIKKENFVEKQYD